MVDGLELGGVREREVQQDAVVGIARDALERGSEAIALLEREVGVAQHLDHQPAVRGVVLHEEDVGVGH